MSHEKGCTDVGRRVLNFPHTGKQIGIALYGTEQGFRNNHASTQIALFCAIIIYAHIYKTD